MWWGEQSFFQQLPSFVPYYITLKSDMNTKQTVNNSILNKGIFIFCALNIESSLLLLIFLVWQECGVTSILAVLGLLCKEQAMTVLAICCIYEFVIPKVSCINLIRFMKISRFLLLLLFSVDMWF